MATTKTIQATVKNRTDTAANWTQKNPVLAEGEIIVVQTNAGETRLKIGDGVKTFTQLPYTDEQIYNNVVTSVNGQTGDITTNSVEYTEQTLTDEQKKQARENIGAGEANNGLTKVDLYAPNPLKPAEPYSFSLYVKEGNILPYSDSASDNIKNAYQSLYFIVTFGITYNKESQHKSLAKGLAEAYTAGLITAPLIAYGEPYTTSGKIIRFYARDNFRQTSITFRVGSTMEYVYDAEADTFTTCEFTDGPIQPSTRDLSTTQPAVFQFNMSADPATDMQVATKKYVDSSIPTVPDSIKNPNALTFTGAATGTYDGSEAVTINIPEGGTGSLKKLTFTGAATGEYDGTTDVSIDIPSNIYVVPLFEAADTFDRDFDELVNAIKNHKTLILSDDREATIIHEAWFNFDSSKNIEAIILLCTTIFGVYVFNINRTTKEVTSDQFKFPLFDSSTLDQKSGSVYWDKDANKYVIKDISSTSGSSDYVINVTLDTKQSSIGNWVLGYSCTCDKTYAEVLAAYQSGAKVIAHVMRNKEITLSDGSKKTIPIINEAPLTRYIAAQNLLVFDYVHNATDLSVSSGGLTYTTGDSGDSMICYVATYQFAFGAADTSADSVQIPTTTKVQDMIDTSISSIGANEYTIQVSNTAPATGTSNKVITFVVEGE